MKNASLYEKKSQVRQKPVEQVEKFLSKRIIQSVLFHAASCTNFLHMFNFIQQSRRFSFPFTIRHFQYFIFYFYILFLFFFFYKREIEHLRAGVSLG
jgi:hypothetical protein